MIKSSVEESNCGDEAILDYWGEDYSQIEFKVKRNLGQCFVNNKLYLSYKGIHKVVDIISPSDLIKKKIKGFPYRDFDSDLGEIDDILILVCE